MGRSQTYNVYGVSAAEKVDENTTRRYECLAMTKSEMVQEKAKMSHRGTPVVAWAAQTARGCQMLSCGGDFVPFEHELVSDMQVKHVAMVECPICHGKSIEVKNGVRPNSCPVCNNSGLTRKGHWKRWNDWQLDHMRERFT